MEIEGFRDAVNTIYIAKQLYDLGKYELVEQCFCDELDYDMYFENMLSLINGISDFFECECADSINGEIQFHSNQDIEDFFILAGQYGKINRIKEPDNPYIAAAMQEAGKQFNFSYCLDWKLICKTKPKYTYHSRLLLFISYDDYVDLAHIACGLIHLYEWFEEKCDELRKRLDKTNQEVIAA